MADVKELMFLDLTGLTQYDTKIKQYIDSADSVALKGVALSEDGKKMLFYTDLPIEGATPAHEVELPETDLSGVLAKFESATAGNVVTVAEDGKTIVDSGIALTNLATASELNTVKATADEAKSKVEALEALVGVIPDGYEATTIVGYIQEVAANIVANGYDDAELQAKVASLQDAIDTLNGDENTAGSVKKTVADEIAKIVADAPENLDTLKEMSDWITTHTNDATAMNSAIVANTSAIDALEAYVGTLPEDATATTVVDYIAEALTASNLDQYAKASDLTAAIERIAANEQAISVINAALAENGTTYNQIAEAKKAGTDAQAAVDALASYVGQFTAVDGEETVVAYIDAKVSKVSADIEARLKALEDAVDAINDEESGILAQSKAYTDELANGQVRTNTDTLAEVKATVDNISAISEEDIDALFE